MDADKFRISPNNRDEGVSLFLYDREIIRIDNKGFLSQYYVNDSHERTLRKIYGGYDRDIIELLYMANMKGDILFVIENSGLIIWLPPYIIERQKEKALSKLDSLKDIDDVDIYMGIANVDSFCDYKMINNGKTVSIDKAIDYLLSIKIDNEYTAVKK